MPKAQGPPYVRDARREARLDLPASLIALHDSGVWTSIHGHNGRGRCAVLDETLRAKIGGATLELRQPPFSSYAGWAMPFDRKDPNNRLLEAIFGAKSNMDSMEKQHGELQQERALADLDPELAIEIAVFDSYDIAGIVLDYRLDPPPDPDAPAWAQPHA